MKTQLTERELRSAGWAKYSADWYWNHPDTPTTHVHLRGSTRGPTVDIRTISIKVNDVGIGQIWNGSTTNWGLLDEINAADATFFREGLNAVGIF